MSLIYNHKEITKNSKGELVYVKTLGEVCEYKAGTKGEISSKYECKVDPNKDPYTFYILSYLDEDGNIITDKTNAKSVNLIMDSNIATGGIAVKDSNLEDKGAVAWINRDDFLTSGGTLFPYDGGLCWDETGCTANDKGPITAMNYLEEVTKTWTNINEIKISEFTDETGKSYTMAKTYNIYARMPYYGEVESVSKETIWLIDYLCSHDDEYYEIEGRKGVDGVNGYWILSTDAEYFNLAWRVNYGGNAGFGGVDIADYFGVRPVITLKF